MGYSLVLSITVSSFDACHIASVVSVFNKNKCIGDDTKDAARQNPNCIKNK